MLSWALLHSLKVVRGAFNLNKRKVRIVGDGYRCGLWQSERVSNFKCPGLNQKEVAAS